MLRNASEECVICKKLEFVFLENAPTAFVLPLFKMQQLLFYLNILIAESAR